MRISQLAERSGVPATTLRFYESAGLLTADRTPAGYRSYGQDAVRRLAFIGAAKHLGLALEEIAELLAVWQTGACVEVKADLRPRIAARLVQAEQRASEIAAFTASLHSALEHLDALPDRTTRCDPECGFLSRSADRSVELVLSPSREAAEKGAERRAAREAVREAEHWRSAPIACSLTGDDMTERLAQWRSALAGAADVGIPDGRRFTVPAGRFSRLSELAAAEQRCCPFFDFRFHLDGRDLHFEVRAPAEAAALLADVFAAG
jgi:MerR family transcriptional regulator, copper efflux regulator